MLVRCLPDIGLAEINSLLVSPPLVSAFGFCRGQFGTLRLRYSCAPLTVSLNGLTYLYCGDNFKIHSAHTLGHAHHKN